MSPEALENIRQLAQEIAECPTGDVVTWGKLGMNYGVLLLAVPKLLKHIEEQEDMLKVAGERVVLHRNGTYQTWEPDERCSTCNELYTKEPTSRAGLCSNGFHCCRDCVWVLGRRINLCADHQEDV